VRNKYAADCYRCGQRVEVGDGHFERNEGVWRTQHADCAIHWRGRQCSIEEGRLWKDKRDAAKQMRSAS